MTKEMFLDEKVFLLLAQGDNLSRKIADKALAAVGMTIAEYTLLRIIQNTPRITAAEARKRLLVSAPSVAQLVKSLRGKSLIVHTEDRLDIRRQPIVLSAKGKKAIANARASVQKALRELRVPATVLESLRRDLTVLISFLSPYGR